jgi:hypothetical protein
MVYSLVRSYILIFQSLEFIIKVVIGQVLMGDHQHKQNLSVYIFLCEIKVIGTHNKKVIKLALKKQVK